MNKENDKSFLTLDSRKIVLFLAIPVCIVAIMLSGLSLFPLGFSSDSILVVPQVLLGIFLTSVTAPFTLMATILAAFGINLLYSTGVAAKTGIAIGIVATVFWWYIISCLVISIYNKIKHLFWAQSTAS